MVVMMAMDQRNHSSLKLPDRPRLCQCDFSGRPHQSCSLAYHCTHLRRVLLLSVL